MSQLTLQDFALWNRLFLETASSSFRACYFWQQAKRWRPLFVHLVLVCVWVYACMCMCTSVILIISSCNPFSLLQLKGCQKRDTGIWSKVEFFPAYTVGPWLPLRFLSGHVPRPRIDRGATIGHSSDGPQWSTSLAEGLDHSSYVSWGSIFSWC